MTVEVVPKFIPGWIQLRHRMKGPGGDIVNCFSLRPSVSGTRYSGSQLNALASDFATAVGNYMIPTLGTAITLVDVVAQDLGDALGESGSYVYPAGTVGTSTGELLPGNCAIASTWRTRYRGAKYRGRTYWGGFTEAATNADTFTSAFVVAVFANISRYFAWRGPVGTPVFPVVASRKWQLLTDISGIALTAIMDSQRRRLTGHGR